MMVVVMVVRHVLRLDQLRGRVVLGVGDPQPLRALGIGFSSSA